MPFLPRARLRSSRRRVREVCLDDAVLPVYRVNMLRPARVDVFVGARETLSGISMPISPVVGSPPKKARGSVARR